jgi:adenylate kinase family enzyme
VEDLLDDMATDRPAYPIGRRIAVWGATGSGKTTLARRLADILALHFVDLDAIRHAHGWDSVPYDEMSSRLVAQLDAHPEGWAIAGSYSAIFDAYVPRIDTLVWLRLPWPISFWRLLGRTLRRAVDRGELYPGSPARESWRQTFFSRQSILLWSITQHRHVQRRVSARRASLPSHVIVQELRSTREVDAFVRAVEIASQRVVSAD